MITQEILKTRYLYSEKEKGLVWDTPDNFRQKNGKTLGTNRPDGYLSANIDKKMYLIHRLVWLYHYGEFPNGFIDHIDGDKTNNTIDNLRDVTPEESNRNIPKPADNTSGVVGVSWSTHANMWLSRINHEKRTINLGYFKDFEDAVSARKQAEVNYKYHSNHGREL